jgi:pimeloyl-ACP methyl ester carboxylesterase
VVNNRVPSSTDAGEGGVEVVLQRCGFELHGERWSGGERGHVLLLHGLGGNSVTWHGVAPILARQLGVEVLAVDMPGFGRSRTGGRKVDVTLLVELSRALLETEAPAGTRWILAGNSLGAVLALRVACSAPRLVAGVSVAAPALPLYWGRGLRGIAALSSWLPAALPFLGRRLISRYMTRTGLPGVVDQPIRALFGDATRLDAVLRERLLGVSGYRLGWTFEAGRAYEEVTRSLGAELFRPGRAERWIREAPCPVQAIRGDRDPIFGVGAWERLERLRPEWDYVTLQGVGHVPQLEAPGEVTCCLADWIGRLILPPPLRPGEPSGLHSDADSERMQRR